MNPFKFLVQIFIASFLASCASSQVKVAMSSGPQLNPDANHQSLPVVARIYQLKDKQQFDAANFNTLWKDDNKYLGQDLLSKEEILIYPGDKKIIPMIRHENAQYIAVVALFRDYKQGNWRTVVPVKGKVKLQLNNNELALIK
jgi:type VI secretion system protein VasD